MIVLGISLSGGRFQSRLREIRSRATDVHDKEKGIKITEKDWEKLNAQLLHTTIFLLLLDWLPQQLVLHVLVTDNTLFWIILLLICYMIRALTLRTHDSVNNVTWVLD
ncbi:hypothetical protein PRUPE_2G078500 [Prunus persica]|uniref:Uncharacterized protein n=1 Tax=Prunus persica TaxID=3760 RepID=A0A251QE26_PRUPE|nr:hypothetical protein PRUPE_2G078500 [Prunus persica]